MSMNNGWNLWALVRSIADNPVECGKSVEKQSAIKSTEIRVDLSKRTLNALCFGNGQSAAILGLSFIAHRTKAVDLNQVITLPVSFHSIELY